MANTGFKQATIAYKVSKPGGEPLDINGELTRISGRKQAIALLVGASNPNPSKYEVEAYFNRQGQITGRPTITYNVTDCPIGYFRVTPSQVVLEPSKPTAVITLEASNSWVLLNPDNVFCTIDYTSGAAGAYQINVKRTDTLGQKAFNFQNIATKQIVTVYIANVTSKPWILETGNWNTLGFWYDNGVWNYGT